jgi:hypothetical protein
MNQATAPVTVSPGQRADILRFASWLLTHADRADTRQVLDSSAPLLEWASSAADSTDLRCRMAAMQRAHDNTAARPGTLSPAQFLVRADGYYRFITGGGTG